MSDSTWHFITPSPSFGWLFGNMVLPRFVSMWQEMFEKTYEWFDLIACLERIPWIIVTRWVLQPFTTAYILLHRSYRLHGRNCPGRTRAGDAFYYSDDAYCRLVTSALELWPRRSPHRHGAPSPSFVLRPPWADRRFLLRPAAEPMTYSGRPPRPRPRRRSSSAVQPRDVSSILTIPSDIHPNSNINFHSVGTYMLVVVIVIFIGRTAPNS